MKKIKNKNITAWFGIFLLSPIILLLASCSGITNNKIVVANFESYIAPPLEEELIKSNNVDYKSFSSNEQAEREFVTNHNISVPSSYVAIKLIKEGSVEPINWPSITGGKIANATDALTYFTKDIKNLLISYDLDNDPLTVDNLLEWSIPYFAQDLVIGYKSNTNITNVPSIEEAIELIGSKTGKGKEFNRISMIDDTRTMYGLSRRINGKLNINPDVGDKSIKDFNKELSPLKNYLGDDKVIFNTDSGVALNDFANDNGSDVLIAYNGDLLYATYGGDSGVLPSKNIQLYRPTDSITQALELVVVNKNLYQKLDSKAKLNIWEIMRKLSFDLPKKGESWEDSWSYKNFDFVNYTPTIKGLYDFLITDNWYEFDPLQKQIFQLNELKSDLIDTPITNEQQFNMQYAYMETKSKM